MALAMGYFTFVGNNWVMSSNIPGIYNYCDRWCERCCLTDRCAVYESEKNAAAEKKDENLSDWDKVVHNLHNSFQLIRQMAKEQGIDLNSIPQEELDRIDVEQKEVQRLVRSDALIQLCREYGLQARKIMENEELWKIKGEEMIQQEKMGVVDILELEDQLRLMKECRAVICWYLFFIEVKFSRALSGLLEKDEEDSIQSDVNGSAKIALIAVDRSREAWTHLFTLIPDEDSVLPILASLIKIDNTAREKFPNAIYFLRPGFDDNIGKANDIVFTPKSPANQYGWWK